MKKKMFTLMAMMLGTAAAMAQITEIPFEADFEEATAPFDAGEVVTPSDANLGKILCVANTTATATFDAPYQLGQDEQVTVVFTAFHGWASGSPTATISLVNSEGVTLAGYTYSINKTNVTDITLGGQTAAGFEAFHAQSKWNNDSRKNSANGYNGSSQYYKADEGYTPVVTIKLSGSGAVSFNMNMSAKNVDKTYTANLEGVKMDLAKIVITDDNTTAGRSICIDNLQITTRQVVLHKYQVKYVDEEGNTVKTEESSAEEGTIVSIADAVVWADGVKYYVLSNDSEDNPVDNSDSTVITVKVKKAATYKYTVTAMAEGTTLATLAEGSYYEGENVGYAYPRYFNVDGTLYMKDATNMVYQGSFTLDEDGKAVTAEYAATENTNVIFFQEAEDIDVLTACKTGTVTDRCSYRAGGYAKEEVTLLQLAAGTYKLSAAAYGGAYTFKAGEQVVLDMPSQGSWRENHSEEFTLAEPTALTFVGGTGEAGSLDYVYLQSTDGNVTTAISTVSAVAKTAEGIYNLNGQRMEKAVKGLYIINGKKVMVK